MFLINIDILTHVKTYICNFFFLRVATFRPTPRTRFSHWLGVGSAGTNAYNGDWENDRGRPQLNASERAYVKALTSGE